MTIIQALRRKGIPRRKSWGEGVIALRDGFDFLEVFTYSPEKPEKIIARTPLNCSDILADDWEVLASIDKAQSLLEALAWAKSSGPLSLETYEKVERAENLSEKDLILRVK